MGDIAGISICIITYNQDKYIERAIESALMQEGDFREIIISDDCSTDNTKAVITRYANKYPGLIKAYYTETNLGMLRNWEKALKLCTSQYIALLEGDDYWNDPLKLQKQHKILESHPDCVISFTNAVIEYDPPQPDGYTRYVDKTGEFFTLPDLLEYNFIPTCSVLMRNHISATFFPPPYFKSPFADWIIHILNSRYGKMHFLNEFSCTYLVHGMGVWGGIKKEKQLLNKLKAIDCVIEILEEPELQPIIANSRKKALRDICLHYKKQKKAFAYLKYRLQLMLT